MKISHKIAYYVLWATLGILWGANSNAQGVFNKYAPQPGIQVSTGVDYHNTAAASSDVIGLWSGCTGSNFLRGDGTCNVPAGTGVSSVTVPAPLTATTCTGGACAITWTTAQTANRILATPDGTTGSVSLRAMVAGDVPPINLGSTANGGVSSATILLGTNGGTSNGFFSVTGPTTALRTFTFPNASATVLTTNAAVTVPQGGTGLTTLTANGVLLGEGTSNVSPLVMGADTVLRGTASADPVATAVPNCGSSTTALNYNTTTHAFGCQTISAGGTPGGSTTQIQFNNAGSFGGASNFTYATATGLVAITAPSGTGDALAITAKANNNGFSITAPNTAGQSFGGVITAGTNSSDWQLLIRNAAGTATGFEVRGDGVLIGNGNVVMTPVQGTFTMTYNGFTSPPGLTSTYYCAGNMCTLVIPGSAVAASNATTFTATGLPAAIQPAQTQQLGMFPSFCEDNSVIGGFTCGASITGGTITFAKNNTNTGWTASGQKGIATSLTVTYLLN